MTGNQTGSGWAIRHHRPWAGGALIRSGCDHKGRHPRWLPADGVWRSRVQSGPRRASPRRSRAMPWRSRDEPGGGRGPPLWHLEGARTEPGRKQPSPAALPVHPKRPSALHASRRIRGNGDSDTPERPCLCLPMWTRRNRSGIMPFRISSRSRRWIPCGETAGCGSECHIVGRRLLGCPRVPGCPRGRRRHPERGPETCPQQERSNCGAPPVGRDWSDLQEAPLPHDRARNARRS